jgi:hypothetical protein
VISIKRRDAVPSVPPHDNQNVSSTKGLPVKNQNLVSVPVKRAPSVDPDNQTKTRLNTSVIRKDGQEVPTPSLKIKRMSKSKNTRTGSSKVRVNPSDQSMINVSAIGASAMDMQYTSNESMLVKDMVDNNQSTTLL